MPSWSFRPSRSWVSTFSAAGISPVIPARPILWLIIFTLSPHPSSPVITFHHISSLSITFSPPISPSFAHLPLPFSPPRIQLVIPARSVRLSSLSSTSHSHDSQRYLVSHSGSPDTSHTLPLHRLFFPHSYCYFTSPSQLLHVPHFFHLRVPSAAPHQIGNIRRIQLVIPAHLILPFLISYTSPALGISLVIPAHQIPHTRHLFAPARPSRPRFLVGHSGPPVTGPGVAASSRDYTSCPCSVGHSGPHDSGLGSSSPWLLPPPLGLRILRHG